MQDKIESLYQQYPKVLEVFDTEQAAELTKEECAALIKIMELTNQLTDMELQSIYFRGCYDSVGYLKKAGIAIEASDEVLRKQASQFDVLSNG